MEYKRLKEKLETILTLPELPFEEDLTAIDCKQMYDILCKIEQGTLIELPCKVGDTVYAIPHIWDNKGRFVGEIDKRKAEAFYVIGEFVDIEDDIVGEFYRFGEEVFLTREEAEKRLKELQNG